jgi:hypothetical protein
VRLAKAASQCSALFGNLDACMCKLAVYMGCGHYQQSRIPHDNTKVAEPAAAFAGTMWPCSTSTMLGSCTHRLMHCSMSNLNQMHKGIIRV